MERRPGGATWRGDRASELAREERAGRQKRYLARILGAFLFRVSPRLRPGQRQLAPGTRLRWATPRRSGVERFPLRRVSFACETDGHRKRARAGPANAPRLRGDEQAQSDRKSTRLNSSHEWISYA